MMTRLLAVVFICYIFNVVSSSPYVVTFDELNENEVNPTTERHLLGQKRCTRGPAYWCHNITQAKECGAVKHCIGKVWEQMKLPADNDDVCDICKEMVKEARDQLLSNETQDELRQVLEGSCKLIPLKVISSECTKLADEFIPELIDALASRMDPQTVCAVSGLCNSVRIDEMLGEFKKIEGSPEEFNLEKDSCPKCTHYIGEALTSIKRLTKDQLLYKIFQTCGYLSSYSDSCRAIAMDEIDNIYDHIQTELNAPEMCGLVGLCEVVSLYPVKIEGSSVGVRTWTPPNVHTTYECDFCKKLVDYLKNWFTTDTTKEEFNEIAVGLCKQTGKYKQECLNLVKEYGDLVYQLITDELDPQKACVFLEQCNQTTTIRGRVTLTTSDSNAYPLWTIMQPKSYLEKLTPPEKIAGDDERPSHQPGFSYPMVKLTPAERLTGDDEWPSHQPGFTYPMVELMPSERLAGDDEFTPIVPKKGAKDILPTCGICTFTVSKLFELLGKNKTKEAIDKAMDSVCDVIPSRYRSECLTFMNEYGDKVAEMIVMEGTAHGVCMALGLCLFSPVVPSQQPIKLFGEAGLPFDRYMPQIMINDELEQQKPKDIESSETCILCEFVLSKIDEKLKDNVTEREIKDTVEQICRYFPKTIRNECFQFLDEYGDEVIQYLVDEMDPKEICTKLKICDKGENEMRKVEEEPISMEDELVFNPEMKMDNCELCTIVANYISAFLDDPSVTTGIENMVERVCPLLSKPNQAECKNLIEDYGPYLISLLSQETDKGKICKAVNLCPAKPAAAQ